MSINIICGLADTMSKYVVYIEMLKFSSCMQHAGQLIKV